MSATPCGMWAFEALRIARGEPRLGLDTDHRAIPNEVGWLGSAVHLDKGCYRGQETVARVHTLGRPPRRLVLLLLDGSVDRLPEPRQPPCCWTTEQVGFVGSAARHYELGPVALALVKRNVPVDAELLADGVAAGPGGHRRPRGRPARPRPPLRDPRISEQPESRSGQLAALIIPAPTVTPVASSIRMNEPVVRLVS